jgi:hypothetical protein
LHAQRQDANNAMMALLAGSKLAVNALRLSDGSTMRMSQIFPRVPHIERFDLRVDAAAQLLDDAEAHLSVMAVPYVLALHEDYMIQCGSLLVSIGRMTATVLQALTPKTMHERFAAAAGTSLNGDHLLLFHLLRTMRNCQIHQGARANAELVSARSALSSSAEAIWVKLTSDPAPLYALGDDVPLRQRDLIACLAITSD